MFGIEDTNTVVIDSSDVADDEYARFTANGLESRDADEVKTDLSLDNVENVAISTWTGFSDGTIETLNTTTEIQAPLISYTDGDDAITIEDGGYLKFNAGVKYSPAVQVNTQTNGNVGDDWIKIAEAVQLTGNESCCATFLLSMAAAAHNSMFQHNTDYIVNVRIAKQSETIHADSVYVVAMPIDASQGLSAWDPSTDLLVNYSSSGDVSDLWVKVPSSYSNVFVTHMGSSDNVDSATYESLGWKICSGQSWASAAPGSNTNVEGTWASTVLSKLGIGTDDPDALLHIKGDQAVDPATILIEEIHATTGGGDLRFIKSRSGGAVSSGDYLGNIQFRAHDGTDAESTAAVIRVRADGAASSNNTPGRIEFLCNAGAAAATQHMVLKSDGKLGIGTTNPNAKLTVEGVLSLDEQSSSPADTSGYGKMFVKTSDSALYYRNDLGTEFNLAAGPPALWQSNVGGKVHLVNEDDNVILGSSGTPQAKLHIVDEPMTLPSIPSNTLLMLEDDGDCAIQLIGDGAGELAIKFGNTETAIAAQITCTSAESLMLRTNDTSRLMVDQDGSVVIGTYFTDVEALLDIRADDNTATIQIRDDHTTGGPDINFKSSNSSGAVYNGALLGRLQFYGHDGTDLTTRAGEIAINVDGTVSTDVVPGELVIKLNDPVGATYEVLRISSGGALHLNRNPAFKTYMTTSEELTGGGGFEIIPFDTADGTYGVGGFNVGDSFDTTTHLWTAPESGLYQMLLDVVLQNPYAGSGDYIEIALIKDIGQASVETERSRIENIYTGSAGYTTLHIGTILNVTEGDEWGAYIDCEDVGALNITHLKGSTTGVSPTGYTRWSCVKVG